MCAICAESIHSTDTCRCACKYTYMSIHTCIMHHVYVLVCRCLHIHIATCTQAHMYTCYTHTRTRGCNQSCMHFRLHTSLRTCIHPCIHTQLHAYLPTYTHANTPDLMLHKAQTLRGMFTQYSQQPSVLAIKTATWLKQRPEKIGRLIAKWISVSGGYNGFDKG